MGADYSVTHGYDATGRFETVSWNVGGSAQTATYSYVPDSDLLYQLTTDNGQQTTFSYEPNRNLKTQVKNELNSQLVSQYDYQYDPLGRRGSVANSGLSFAAVTNGFNRYAYNDRNELTGSSRYLGTDINDFSDPVRSEDRNYLYDSIGNRSQAMEDTLTRTYAPNALNQYDQITTDNGQPTTHNLFYDEDGNLTAATISGSDRNLTYNAENRLISIDTQTPADGDQKVEFQYDYMGRRVQKKFYAYSTDTWSLTSDTLFLYDGWNLIEELKTRNSEFKTRYYVWGLDLSQSLQGAGGIGGLLAAIEPVAPAIIALDLDGDNDIDGMDLNMVASNPGQVDLTLFAGNVGKADISSPLVHQYLYDANGNVGQMVDVSDGSIAAHYEYDPFGNVVCKTGSYVDENPFRFSTKFTDQETGLIYYGYRYYSAEMGRWLTRDSLGEKGGLNLYAFALNDLVNEFDPFGLQSSQWNSWNASNALHGDWRPPTIPDTPGNISDNNSGSFFDDLMNDIAEQNRKYQDLGLDWHDGDMMDSLDLLDERQKNHYLINEDATEKALCFSCFASCSMKVIGITYAQDMAARKILKSAATALAKEWIKKSIPVYNVASAINTAYGIGECFVSCSKSES